MTRIQVLADGWPFFQLSPQSNRDTHNALASTVTVLTRSRDRRPQRTGKNISSSPPSSNSPGKSAPRLRRALTILVVACVSSASCTSTQEGAKAEFSFSFRRDAEGWTAGFAESEGRSRTGRAVWAHWQFQSAPLNEARGDVTR